jgi:hypothetical protein
LPGVRAVPFTAGFTDREVQATGLSQLSGAERAKLDQLVGRDADFAQEGGVVAFDKTFSARLRPVDFRAAGLDHLSGRQLGALNDLAAFRIAHPVVEAPHFVAKEPPKSPSLAAGQIAQGAGLSPASVSAPGWHPEVHGEIALTVGGGKGGSFYGGGADVVITDPEHGFTLALGYAQFRGKGFYGPAALAYCAVDPLLAGVPGRGPDPGLAFSDDPNDPTAVRSASPRSASVPPR